MPIYVIQVESSRSGRAVSTPELCERKTLEDVCLHR